MKIKKYASATPAPRRQNVKLDNALIDDLEKDLLVLLYYCDLVNLKASPDETVAQLIKIADTYGIIKDLDLRKELLSEIEVGFSVSGHKYDF
ncbi:hypothetical protein K4K60_005950 [Colletotrichum sp. SAR11_57]|nr:hypothetical protein K4K60_005950 [Colletotrichum sp. SAR11_57]